MKVSAALPTGVAALLFESAKRRRGMEQRLVARLAEAGYAEAILPILDYLEPYESLLTPASRGELYRFIDRDGEQLALRADFTPMLARLLAPRLHSMPLPLRLFYRGDVIRYEEERAGRQREFYQLGAELLGVPGEPGEREVLRLFLEALAASGIGGDRGPVQVVLGLAGCLDRLLLGCGAADPVALASALGRRDRGEVRRHCPQLLPVLETGLPERPEDLGEGEGRRLRGLLELRDEMAGLFPEVDLFLDLAEFSDRSYYDGLVFRAFAGPSALPVGGGGRYDRMFRALGAEVAAAGFSVSVDRLLESVP